MNTSSKKGFGLSELIVRIILIALFVLLLIWLFRNYSPNMKPFYNNVFRENVSYMQNAAKSYFTNDQLPTEVGKSIRLTLKQMEEMKLLIPFVDKNGKSCDINKSYAEVTKEEIGYTLKVNLVCGKESNYIIDILGCHDYCNSCNNDSKTALEYEFTRDIKNSVTELSCPKGYDRNGSICTKKTGSETINATSNYTDPSTQISDLLYTIGASQTIELTPIRNINTTTRRQYVDVTVTTKTEKQYTDKLTTTKTEKQYTDKLTSTKTEKQYTDKLTLTETEKQYTDVDRVVSQDCHDERIKDPNCKVECKWEVGSDGIPREVCNTCGYITHRVCTDVTAYICPSGYTKEGSGSSTKCYKNVTKTTYSCPSGYTKEGSGSTLKCYKNVTKTTYSCPSGYTKEGSGSTLKCYKNVTKTTYSCPSGYTKEGSGSTLKCYKNITKTTYSCGTGLIQEGSGSSTKCYKIVSTETVTYSCPREATSDNGLTGTRLKCYKIIEGERTPYCANSNAVIRNGKCVLTISSVFSHYSCPAGYTLNNRTGTCSKDIFDTIKATSTTKEIESTETKWSRSRVLEGWKATGKTRTVKVN